MIVFLIGFVILLVIGVPISISIGASAVLGCLSLGYPMVVIGQKMVSGIDSFLLIAIPLFIFAGNLMNAGSITKKIFNTARELVGWIPGGLGHANVIASVIFAGMSGSAVADAGGLGAIEMEAMKSNGYDEDFSGAVTAASSVIGPIFPPSIPLIIYGSVASVSVSKLFMGGVVPAVIMAVLLMAMVYYFAIRRKYEKHPFSAKALWREFRGSLLALVTPLIILSGFTVGWFTPTEASSVAVIYALIISALAYRSMTWKQFLKCLKDSALSSANTLFIIGSSTLFTYVMAMEGISNKIAGFIAGVATEGGFFSDDLFTDPEIHDPSGSTVMISGLEVRPEYRHMGLATKLMEKFIDRERRRGRKRIVLTCLENLVPFYENMGYRKIGLSKSTFGGAAWYEMDMNL